MSDCVAYATRIIPKIAIISCKFLLKFLLVVVQCLFHAMGSEALNPPFLVQFQGAAQLVCMLVHHMYDTLDSMLLASFNPHAFLSFAMLLCRLVYGADNDAEREVRISCPDATGLGCDVTRMLLDFGLRIVHGDMSTDGKWCFLIFRVSWPLTAHMQTTSALCTAHMLFRQVNIILVCGPVLSPHVAVAAVKWSCLSSSSVTQPTMLVSILITARGIVLYPFMTLPN